MNIKSLALCLPMLAAACTTYTPPEASGLSAVRPYPTAGDVCQIIGESTRVVEYLDDRAILIGCPTHERGAISDRVRDGGELLEVVGSWQLISMPLDVVLGMTL